MTLRKTLPPLKAPRFFIFLLPLKAAPPGGDGDAAEGSCFTSLYINALLNGSVRPSVSSCAIRKPPSRCPISKLSTYSEPSWPCESFKTNWVKIGAQKKFFCCPKWAPKARLRKGRETPPKAAVSRVIHIMDIK